MASTQPSANVSTSLEGTLRPFPLNLSGLEQMFNTMGFADGPIRTLEPPSGLPEKYRSLWRTAVIGRVQDDKVLSQNLARDNCYGIWDPQLGVSLCKYYAVGNCGVMPCEYGEPYYDNIMICGHGDFEP